MIDNREIYLSRMERACARKELDFLSYTTRNMRGPKDQRSWKRFRKTQYREVT